ncbi:outer membrane protein assembly factor BamE [Sphingomonas immobilis]|uniref:Outer membrane protein assembly factor BamE n=1 Tax=Sphingomonas immobilis TaxID=3063997 RepID=A0ABT8ZUU9_9SPHN|nr:outer membrane protein assembly factor BamE [Sphingomonas sp. CA1-15]MDO7841349.1 outer membrane protein assembly factor BamE [Sphingomonas sp. CA1-15]
MKSISARLLTSVALAAAVLPAGACVPLKSHQGYVIDNDLVASVQPGVDTRQSVLSVLGKPSFASQFNQGDWYYLSRDSRSLAFNNPKAKDQTTLRISFDAKGVVTAVTKTGTEQIASIGMMKKTTPTLGRHRSFFQELFGNIGQVGAIGGAPSGGGGGRDQP